MRSGPSGAVFALGALFALGAGGCFVDRSGLGTVDPQPRVEAGVDGDVDVDRDARVTPPPIDAPGLAPPGPPRAPSFMDVTEVSARVHWLAPRSGGAPDTYDLERAADEAVAPSPWTPVATGLASPAFDDDGLSPGTTYRYRARAVNAAGAGEWSPEGALATVPPVQFARVQIAQSDDHDPTAVFAAPPMAGNLLVAIGFYRVDRAEPSMPAGWNELVHEHFATGGGDRRGLTVWAKVAGEGEERDVTLDWTPDTECNLLLQEITAGVDGVTWSLEATAHAHTGTTQVDMLTVGPTAPVPDGDVLVIAAFGSRDDPGSDVVYTDGVANGITFRGQRTVASGFAGRETGGALSTTASWTTDRHPFAALVVYRVTR